MDKIVAIIVHYNTDDDTKKTLASLSQARQTGFKLETIVVDNGSKIPLKLSEKLLSGVTLLRSEVNLGFTGGNNIGIKNAIEKFNPEYFLLLNSDTKVDSDFLVKMYQYIKTKSEIGLVNPKIYFYPGCEYHKGYKKEDLGQIIWYAGGVIDWKNIDSFHIGVDEVDRGQFEKPHVTDFATGCCVLIKRQVLEITGLLNDRLFLYSEDVDLSLRAQRAGFECHYLPTAKIWHKNAGSSDGAGADTSVYYQTRNRLYIGLKYGSNLARIITLRLMWQLFTSGSEIQQKAVIDVIFRNFGKRSII